jgi:hypothetical protein
MLPHPILTLVAAFDEPSPASQFVAKTALSGLVEPTTAVLLSRKLREEDDGRRKPSLVS